MQHLLALEAGGHRSTCGCCSFVLWEQIHIVLHWQHSTLCRWLGLGLSGRSQSIRTLSWGSMHYMHTKNMRLQDSAHAHLDTLLKLQQLKHDPDRNTLVQSKVSSMAIETSECYFSCTPYMSALRFENDNVGESVRKWSCDEKKITCS